MSQDENGQQIHYVYVVEQGMYSSRGVVGVYASPEAAMAAHPIPANYKYPDQPLKYTPSLMEQIKGRHEAIVLTKIPCIIRVAGKHFVKRVDPKTYQGTDEAQQFILHDDNSLTLVPKSQWVSDPYVVDVDELQT